MKNLCYYFLAVYSIDMEKFGEANELFGYTIFELAGPKMFKVTA